MHAKTLPNRGMARVLLAYINTLPPHTTVTTDQALINTVRKEIPSATEQSVVSGLSYLKSQGHLTSEMKGVYSKANGKAPAAPKPTPTDMELIVIDNLLNAMAEAEPVLKRCKKVITALRDFK